MSGFRLHSPVIASSVRGKKTENTGHVKYPVFSNFLGWKTVRNILPLPDVWQGQEEQGKFKGTVTFFLFKGTVPFFSF